MAGVGGASGSDAAGAAHAAGATPKQTAPAAGGAKAEDAESARLGEDTAALFSKHENDLRWLDHWGASFRPFNWRGNRKQALKSAGQLKKAFASQRGELIDAQAAVAALKIDKRSLQSQLTAEKNKSPAVTASDSGKSDKNDTATDSNGVKYSHLFAVTGIFATVTGLLIFLMMEHQQKKTLKTITRLKQQNTQLQQAVQAANDGTGYGADPSNQGYALAS